jgi:hypothetical protein
VSVVASGHDGHAALLQTRLYTTGVLQTLLCGSDSKNVMVTGAELAADDRGLADSSHRQHVVRSMVVEELFCLLFFHSYHWL